ncbi:serine/threonine-protein kinase [Pyxidicoccus sp. MSG2]|uniref:serine/threonine-protein kinase n=1 Tax=Pyxidicoccus sp. MSG2 TaxID=2996790 RepID=UPI00226D9D6A|nr:serine/threonine-protein kinase [Pyxidicoccus sp. MSG2]MCY1023101.1 serine/threonine-protein kinase [Pyxidicoccus sp. MSG2]
MALQPGDRFGRYELVSWLGRGGMAETWRARLVGDAGVTRPVLIKKVLPEFSDDEAFISMFISEARISATLSHGNVAQVFDFGQVDGDYFLAMEFVDGQPLHRVLKRAARSGLPALPVPLATFIALEICRGLHYAHTRADEKGAPLGIVHRDISPDNVLVGYEGQVKIVDFGIAKARSLRTFDTEPGVVKGKYLYFSPEQARGKQVDARTDVWATGLVLYELLCGQRPVTGPPQTVMMRMASGDFPSPKELRKDLPSELDEIVMRALSVKLAGRFESSHAFGDALAGFLYNFAPRFSSMNLAHLVRALFREELAKEGRELAVPPAFMEELAAWRNTAPTAATARESPAPGLSPSLSRGILIAGGAVVLTLGAVAVLPHAWDGDSPVEHEPSSLQPQWPTNSDGTPAPGAPHELAKGAPIELRLNAQRDVILVPRSLVAFSGLAPTLNYGVSEISDASSPEPKWLHAPSASNVAPIFYVLSGASVSGDAELGEVTRDVLGFQGASAISFFTLGSASQGQASVRDIQLVSSLVGSEKEFVFRPEAMTASVAKAALLEGLSESAMYSLTLTPVGEGAFVHGLKRSPVRRVACVQWAPPGLTAGQAEGWSVAFLLEQGTEVFIEGIDALRCGFVDDDPSDNQGHMLVRATPIDDVQNGARQTPLRGQIAEASLMVARAREQLNEAALTRNYWEALQTAERCLRLVPDHADCLMFSGTSLARMGRGDEAAVRYRRFVERHPNHPKAEQVRHILQAYDQSQLP